MKFCFIKRINLFLLMGLTLLFGSCAAALPTGSDTSTNTSESIEDVTSADSDSERNNKTSEETSEGDETGADSSSIPNDSEELENDSASDAETDVELPEVVLP